jgi:hypothetical protein
VLYTHEADRHLARAHRALVRVRLELSFWRLRAALRPYNPDQPRMPAGHTDGGQWVDDGSAPLPIAEFGEPSSPAQERVRLAGGVDKERLGMKVQSFVSAHCKGSIRAVLPRQFLPSTIADVMQVAKRGDAAARTCLKVLSRDQYSK